MKTRTLTRLCLDGKRVSAPWIPGVGEGISHGPCQTIAMMAAAVAQLVQWHGRSGNCPTRPFPRCFEMPEERGEVQVGSSPSRPGGFGGLGLVSRAAPFGRCAIGRRHWQDTMVGHG